MLATLPHECLDMEWYGVDKKGNIAVFCSAGTGFLPGFVCEDTERADKLIDYFYAAEKIKDSMLLFCRTESAQQAARNFSDKGLYYYDADDGTGNGSCVLREYYTKQSSPQKPLNYRQLPKHIREFLRQNFMEIEDFSLKDTLYPL